MRARLGLREVIARAAHNDVLLMIQIVMEHLLEREDLRLAVDQRKHDDAERLLHGRVLIQLIEHDFGVDVFFSAR